MGWMLQSMGVEQCEARKEVCEAWFTLATILKADGEDRSLGRKYGLLAVAEAANSCREQYWSQCHAND